MYFNYGFELSIHYFLGAIKILVCKINVKFYLVFQNLTNRKLTVSKQEIIDPTLCLKTTVFSVIFLKNLKIYNHFIFKTVYVTRNVERLMYLFQPQSFS